MTFLQGLAGSNALRLLSIAILRGESLQLLFLTGVSKAVAVVSVGLPCGRSNSKNGCFVVVLKIYLKFKQTPTSSSHLTSTTGGETPSKSYISGLKRTIA
jgi:hypothetical protein